MLPGGEELKVITLLQDGTVVGGDVQANRISQHSDKQEQSGDTYNSATTYSFLEPPKELIILTSSVL